MDHIKLRVREMQCSRQEERLNTWWIFHPWFLFCMHLNIYGKPLYKTWMFCAFLKVVISVQTYKQFVSFCCFYFWFQYKLHFVYFTNIFKSMFWRPFTQKWIKSRQLLVLNRKFHFISTIRCSAVISFVASSAKGWLI